MHLPSNSQKKMMSALQLLSGVDISVSTFENILQLLEGIHPEIDKKLAICTKALEKLQKVQSGDIISLSAENLPEENEEDKKRKKVLLFFIQSIKDLQSEIKRVQTEMSVTNPHEKWMGIGRIIKFAKGPFGIITLVAVIIVGLTLATHHSSSTQSSTSPVTVSNKQKIQIIMYNGKEIPLSQLRIGQPHYPNCDSQHYHANSQAETVTALDGTVLLDPGNCGFGKVKDVQVISITR